MFLEYHAQLHWPADQWQYLDARDPATHESIDHALVAALKFEKLELFVAQPVISSKIPPQQP